MFEQFHSKKSLITFIISVINKRFSFTKKKIHFFIEDPKINGSASIVRQK